jgi:hypothetical protein
VCSIFSITYVQNIFHSNKHLASYAWDATPTNVSLRVRTPLLLSDFNSFGLGWHILVELANIKFHENLFSGSQAVIRGQTDGLPDMMKLTAVFFKLLAWMHQKPWQSFIHL